MENVEQEPISSGARWFRKETGMWLVIDDLACVSKARFVDMVNSTPNTTRVIVQYIEKAISMRWFFEIVRECDKRGIIVQVLRVGSDVVRTYGPRSESIDETGLDVSQWPVSLRFYAISYSDRSVVSETIGEEGQSMCDEVVVNENGGKQSRLDSRPDLLPAKALLRISEVLGEGAKKYGAENWRLIPWRDHMRHALQHWFLYYSGDRSEDHLGHMGCRVLFALEQHIANPDEQTSAEQQRLIMGLAERVSAQSELLSKKAEKRDPMCVDEYVENPPF